MTGSQDWQDIGAQPLVGQIRDELRRKILAGALEPNALLRDSVLAMEMGVSRAPVREALRSLEQAGLVRKVPNRSYAVASFSLSDLADLSNLRIALETLAARLTTMLRSDLSSLRAAVGTLAAAVQERDDVAILAADRAFHEELLRASQNDQLISVYAQIRDRIELALNATGSMARGGVGILGRHEVLVEELLMAQETQNPAHVIALLEDHVSRGLNAPPLPPVRTAPRPVKGARTRVSKDPSN